MPFTRRQKRDAFFEKARKLQLNNKGFGNASTLPVFVNEHLWPTLKRLVAMAVSKKRESGWKYVWSRNKKIYARKSDSSQVITIKNEILTTFGSIHGGNKLTYLSFIMHMNSGITHKSYLKLQINSANVCSIGRKLSTMPAIVAIDNLCRCLFAMPRNQQPKTK